MALFSTSADQIEILAIRFRLPRSPSLATVSVCLAKNIKDTRKQPLSVSVMNERRRALQRRFHLFRTAATIFFNRLLMRDQTKSRRPTATADGEYSYFDGHKARI